MFARNVVTFFKELTDKEGKLALDLSNEIHRDTLLTREGEVVHATVRKLLNMPELAMAAAS
jgi:hypothetical protein